MIIFIILFCLLVFGFSVFALVTCHNFKVVRKLFRSGNVSVSGLRGRGKDMLIANVIARDPRPYISNVDYHVKAHYFPLDMSMFDVKNNYRNFISGNVRYFKYQYPENADVYLSDTGIYFPAQYNGELNKEYKQFPVFMALSRQIGRCNFHTNTQALNRPWDKIREQCDQYIVCNSCHYSGNVRFFALSRFFSRIVVQRITTYTNFDAALAGVRPYEHIKAPFSISSKVRAEYKARDRAAFRQFKEDHGEVRSRLLIYVNKSNYDTRIFKKILLGGYQ